MYYIFMSVGSSPVATKGAWESILRTRYALPVDLVDGDYTVTGNPDNRAFSFMISFADATTFCDVADTVLTL